MTKQEGNSAMQPVRQDEQRTTKSTIESSLRPIAARAPARAPGDVVALNPFPGSRPYLAEDRPLFFGREEVARSLTSHILARGCSTLYGPSGCGKSSLLQAMVMPVLGLEYGFRVCTIDKWPTGAAPLVWVRENLARALELGPSDDDVPALIRRGFAQSERPLLLCLDQFEQLFYSGRGGAELDALLAALELAAATRSQDLHVLISLREDYLGRLRDHTRRYPELHKASFRLGPLTVGELVASATAAAEHGVPPQLTGWSHDEVRKLIIQVKFAGQPESDDAEAQAAYAQIICRALWDQRAASASGSVPTEAQDAETILNRHLEATLSNLGAHGEAARRLLEEHLVDRDAHRTLMTEDQALAALPNLSREETLKILAELEKASILRAEQHQGGRFFECGHDWLAKKISDRRTQRLKQEQQDKERKALATRTKLALLVALLSMPAALVFAFLLHKARESEALAREANIFAGAREVFERGDNVAAALLLQELGVDTLTRKPRVAESWSELAIRVLWSGMPETTLHGSGAWVRRVVPSPDGKHFLIVYDDGAATLWHHGGSERPTPLKGHERRTTHAAFDSRGARIVTSSWDKTVKTWAGDGRPEHSFETTGPALYAAFSSDDARVLAIVENLGAVVWNISEGTQIPLPHPELVNSAEFVPPNHVLTASVDGLVRLWDLAVPDAKPQELARSHARANVARVHLESRRFVVATADGWVRVYPLDSASDGPLYERSFSEAVDDVLVSPDGMQLLARTGPDGWLLPLDGAAPRRLKGHTDGVTAMAFEPNGPSILTASFDGTARIWEVSQNAIYSRVVARHSAAIYSAAFTRDGSYVLTGSVDGTARVWPVHGWRPPQVFAGHTDEVVFADFSPDGAKVVSAGDTTVRLWTVAGAGSGRIIDERFDYLASARFAMEGRSIISAADDGRARVHELSEGAEQKLAETVGTSRLTYAEVSPNGQRFATASTAPAVEIWDATTNVVQRTPLKSLKNIRDTPRSAVFDRAGTRVLVASGDGDVQIYDIDGAAEPVRIDHADSGANYSEFSPDQKQVVTAFSDFSVHVVPADGSGTPRVLRGHSGTVCTARFNGKGTRVVSASLDGTARIWDLSGSGSPIVIPVRDVEHASVDYVYAAAFSPDDPEGSKVVTASSDKLVRIWDIANLTPDSIRRDLKAATTECLPAALRVSYLLETEEQARARFESCERQYGRL